ncbi:MAG: histidinol-phosphatase [Promethearchaeota archaeon]
MNSINATNTKFFSNIKSKISQFIRSSPNYKLYYRDYHTHHNRCNHASGVLDEYIISAINHGMKEIGLSDHFPMSLMPNANIVGGWSMSLEEFPRYIEECKELRNKYSEKIIIKIASEVDYYESVFESYKSAIFPYLDDIDYLIGSVHVIPTPDGKINVLDGKSNPTLFHKYGNQLLYTKYYEESRKMAETGFFNIVGHCDLLKISGIHPVDEAWESTLKFLDAVAKNNMAIEINTAGYRRQVGIQYPNKKILRECIYRKIPITLGSDSHKPECIGYRFKDALKILWRLQEETKEQVYLAQFNHRKLTKIPLQ